MRAVTFKGHNIVFAENQEEYQSLPAHLQNDGIATFCLELTPDELKSIRKTRALYLHRLTFGGPVQPIKYQIYSNPKLPVSHRYFTSDVLKWVDDGKTAIFKIQVSDLEIQKLTKTRRVWVSTCTFGAPLQPILLTTKI